MSIWALTAAMMANAQAIQPVLWMNLRGDILVSGQPTTPRFTPGASRTRTVDGVAYNFTGVHGGVLFGDLPALKLSDSITVSAWLNPRSYVNDGPGAEILFRGDDRSGYDPYWFVIQGDGTINFCVGDDHDRAMNVKGELPLNRWTHVTANFNATTGELKMWLNGELVGYSRTSLREFVELDKGWTPGVGVGNVQNDQGPHNQPYNGLLADLRLYSQALTPDQVGWMGGVRRTDITP